MTSKIFKALWGVVNSVQFFNTVYLSLCMRELHPMATEVARFVSEIILYGFFYLLQCYFLLNALLPYIYTYC